jgi:hypothetical protein
MVNLGRAWFAASIAASAVLLIVSAVSPATPFWPFLLLNWLIFAPGLLLVLRRTKIAAKTQKIALITFAAAGFFALYHSDTII